MRSIRSQATLRRDDGVENGDITGMNGLSEMRPKKGSIPHLAVELGETISFSLSIMRHEIYWSFGVMSKSGRDTCPDERKYGEEINKEF